MSSESVSSGTLSDFEVKQVQASTEQASPSVDVVAYRESDEGKAFLAWCMNNYKRAKSAREPEERQWKKNLAMYNGKQYLEVVRAGKYAGALVEKPRLSKDERKIINRTEPLVRTEISRIVSQKPSATVVPASADDEDMFAAMAGEQIWESHSHRRKYFSKLTEAAFWLSITGNGIIKTFWDDSVIDKDSGMPGDVLFENVSPFNFLVADLRDTDLEGQPWVCNFYTKSVEWCYLAYPEALEGVKLAPNANADEEIIESTYLGITGGSDAKPDSVVVYEFWFKPGAHKSLPNGGRLVVIDNVIVDYQDSMPYDHGEYPFAHSGHILTGKFYRRSVLNSTNALNEDYNSWRTHLGTARNRMAKPQMAAYKGSINAARMSNTTGLVVEVRPGFQMPQPLPLAQMPQYVMEEGSNILTDIEDISGQHQVSKGNVPPGVTAATAISYLQEKDDSYLTPTYQSVEAMCEKVARQTLSLVVQYWDAPRLVKTGGDDAQFDVMMLAGSDIRNGTDVRVEPGSALPTSKAAKQALIMDLMNAGHVPSDQGLEMLEIGGSSRLMDLLKIDKRQAQRENVKLKSISDEDIAMFQQEWEMRQMSGDPETFDAATRTPLEVPPVLAPNSWDNHEVHIETHNIFRRSQAFELLSPTVKAQFESHVKMHEQLMIQDQLQKAMQMIPTDGSVPGISGLMEQDGTPEAEVTEGGGPPVPSEQTDNAGMESQPMEGSVPSGG